MKKIVTLIIFIILYFLLKNNIPYWYILIYPIRIFVTFLHEFSHAFFALATGWTVESLRINPDWSWLAVTGWWIRDIIVAGWYIWSALFGWILLFLSSRFPSSGKFLILVIISLMIFSGIFLFANITSSILLFLFAVWLYYFKKFFPKSIELLFQCIWIMSLLYIIEDFNVWPSWDLEDFSWLFPIFIWKYVWLAVVIIIFWFFIKISYLPKNNNIK